MDYGLLSLTDYTTPDVLKAIYVPKALQVMTGDNRQRLMSRRPMDVRHAALSGGRWVAVRWGARRQRAGSHVTSRLLAARRLPAVEIRQDFRPLVFWLGSATTGADGRATTTVTLPDSLTTYRIMAVAGDLASQFGFGEREIRVTKPLTLLPAFPRFLSKGIARPSAPWSPIRGRTPASAIVTIQSLDPDTLQFGDRYDADVPPRAGRVDSREVRRAGTRQLAARASG